MTFLNSLRHSTSTDQKSRQSPFFSKTNVRNIQSKEKRPFFQSKLTINQAGDKYEQEADAMAEKVVSQPTLASPQSSSGTISPKCEGCEKEDQLQRMSMPEEEEVQTKPLMNTTQGGNTATAQLASQLNSTKGRGNSLPQNTLSSMNQVFGTDFSNVRVHTDSQAREMSQGIHAKAFTHGSDIYFNKGQYNPGSTEGKRLLGHELTHVVQQEGSDSSRQKDRIQTKKTSETIYEGQDHAGNYKIDTANCRMHYNADWYFKFETGQSDAEKQKYMETAKRHVEATWSNKMKLKPTNSTQDCLCSDEGFSIHVILNPKESSREGQHGFSTTVVSSVRAHVIPPLRTVDLQSNDAIPYTFSHSGTTQKTISHEFGHTLGLPDEYHALSPFKKDYQSIMNVGDTIYPRHYAPFANILNYEILGCNFAPDGKKTPFDIPITKQDYRFLMPIMSEDAPETVFDFHLMRRTSNQAMLGLFHPYVGLQSRMNFGDQTILGGPRAEMDLNWILYPFDVKLGTGLLFGMENDEVRVLLPLDATVGFNIGDVNAELTYSTGIDIGRGDLFNQHLIGARIKF
ncbi:MAG: DUF4157 domain-containing protein [Chitinophagales bacterium]|nr:DUF4157 domain-containing protein [Chitinophagales bacterium]